MRKIFWFVFAFIFLFLLIQAFRINNPLAMQANEILLRIQPLKEKILASTSDVSSSESWFELTSKKGCSMDPWEKECTGLNNLDPNNIHEYCLKQYLANKGIVFSDIYIETIPSGTLMCMACGCEIPKTFVKTSIDNSAFLTNIGFSTSSAPSTVTTTKNTTTTTTATTTTTIGSFSGLTDSMRACTKDMDCLITNETRCSCYYGGNRIAINRSNYINYVRSVWTIKTQCKYNNICLNEYGTYPKCENNLCIKKFRSYCGVKDGLLKDYISMTALRADNAKYQTVANRFTTCQEVRDFFKKYNNFRNYNYTFGIYGAAISKETGK